MKNILLLLHDDIGQEARLQAALDVVRAVNGHLQCLDVTIPPHFVGDFYAGSGAGILLAEERDRENANRSMIEKRLKKEGVSWDWHDVTGTPALMIREFADFADLIVLSSQLGQWPMEDPRRMAGQVVMQTRRPVLTVPETARGLATTGHAVVAWDGSREANQALRLAVPLLQSAEIVTLISFERKADGFSAQDAATYLSRHGIHARITAEQPLGTVADAILNKIEDMDAAYLVMGAFGHSPATEALFGGVTRTLLSASEIPLFLAH